MADLQGKVDFNNYLAKFKDLYADVPAVAQKVEGLIARNQEQIEGSN